ncbi:hypothetical protein ACJJIR_20870 [Microbulbifer sp. SSSA008]|uniref:hypothetical protein n=1 Tax=Microbulbifer sp. SSSA008 TaxID=3243380 RepID=UPI00403A30F3
MNFRFDELLQEGKANADIVAKNNNEIQAVVDLLARSVTSFLDFRVEIFEEAEYETPSSALQRIASNNLLESNKRKPTGYAVLYFRNPEADIKKPFVRIKRSEDGYPISVIHKKNHIVCENQLEFGSALGQVISDPQLHLSLKTFIAKVNAEKSDPDLGLSAPEC